MGYCRAQLIACQKAKHVPGGILSRKFDIRKRIREVNREDWYNLSNGAVLRSAS